MWQHVQLIESKEKLSTINSKIGMVEMKHAEAVAESSGISVDPTSKPAPINVGNILKESLELNTKAEGRGQSVL
jgi:hypothetical protein